MSMCTVCTIAVPVSHPHLPILTRPNLVSLIHRSLTTTLHLIYNGAAFGLNALFVSCMQLNN